MTGTNDCEVIIILQAEMQGYYRNATCENYWNRVNSPDFKAIDQREYSHVTQVEVKNLVGLDIERASRNDYNDIIKQGNNIGDKLSKQRAKLSNASFRVTLSLSNLDPNPVFP